MRRLLALIAVASLGAAACAPIPPPSVLAQLDQVRGAAMGVEARDRAPDAYAHAEALRRDANAALAAGDQAGAEMLGERALAAYAHAGALARVARAQGGTDAADAGLKASKAELTGIDAEQLRVAAEADGLELQVRVARDAQPIQPSNRADPDRERARTAAAKALVLQARLLCSAARLLSTAPAAPPSGDSPVAPPDPKPLEEASAALTKVAGEITALEGGKGAAVAPIDEATRARAGCLAALTAIRRVGTPITKAPGAGDALLAEISAMGTLSPSRDDRGVFVTLRGLFAEGRGGGGGLTPAAAARLGELGRIAAAHPAFPVEVVIHDDRPVPAKDEADRKARAEAVAKAIAGAGGAVRVEPFVAGNASPVVDPAGADRARNARVEIVFVTPETF